MRNLHVSKYNENIKRNTTTNIEIETKIYIRRCNRFNPTPSEPYLIENDKLSSLLPDRIEISS